MYVCVHLASIKAQPRLLPVCEHLPQSDSEHPCVRSMGECSSLEALRGTPATGQTNNISMD